MEHLQSDKVRKIYRHGVLFGWAGTNSQSALSYSANQHVSMAIVHIPFSRLTGARNLFLSSFYLKGLLRGRVPTLISLIQASAVTVPSDRSLYVTSAGGETLHMMAMKTAGKL